MSKHAPLGGSVASTTTIIAAALAAIMVVVVGYRFVFGLGAVTHLSNGYPWGIWIAYDVVIGTAFACGGYAMALVVYILNKGQYHPLVRPALLASMFGYTLGGVSVIFDIGRYWNAWHLLTPGFANPTSVMLEVALCIMAYVVVMWIEFTPVFAEKWASADTKRKLNKVLFVFIALGVLLPTMHQSSLGSMLVAFGFWIHPLWQTDLLPLLYLISALAMGYSIVIFEATLVTAAYRRPSEARLLGSLSKYILWLLVAFLVIRWGDIIAEGKLRLAFSSRGLSWMLLLETALFLLPVALLGSAERRASGRCLFIAAVSMLLGGALYRIDGYLVAYVRPGWHYFPSLGELLTTVGVVALEVLAYIVFVKRLPVLHSVASPKDNLRAPDVAATTSK